VAVLLDENSVSTNEHMASGSAPHEMHYAVPITAKHGDVFEVDSNLPFSSDYYSICTDIKSIAKPSGLPDDKFILLTFIQCVSDQMKGDLIEIVELPGDIESLTVKDKAFKNIFRFLEVHHQFM
jgi:hypothetical protein